MMKSFKLLPAVFVCLLSLIFWGCDPEEGTDGGVGNFGLSVKEVGPDYVDLSVTAPKTIEIAYFVSEKQQVLSPNVLFRKGTVVTVSPAQILRVDTGLNVNTKYYLYAVGRLNDLDFTESVLEISFTTGTYGFDEMLTLMETYPDGFKMHITVPEETKARGNAISYGYGNRALYNMNMFNSRGGGEAMVDMQSVATGSVANGDYCFRDTTVVINDYNQIEYDEDGNPIINSAGDYVTIHDPYIPGEPMLFIAGETRYGSPDEYGAVVGWNQPMGYTWSVPMFDRETMTWTGAFAKKEFYTQMPETCEATLDISFPEDGLGINDAVVAFTPNGDMFRYYYMILNKAAYDEIMTIYLDNDESLWQWFIVSWVAANYYMVEFDTEATYVNAASFFYEPLNGGETYYVMATVLGDDEGLTQRFVRKEFTTKERTKPAPVIDVTTVDTGNPYLAGFNIKAGKDRNGNVQEIKGAYWACEYTREWQKYINAKYDFPSIIQMSLNTFSSDELVKINSDEGLNLYFDTLDGEVLRFGTYGCNDEYCFNIVDEDNRAGWADYVAPMADVDKEPVSSSYFTDLLGEWTATATLNVKEQLPDGSEVDMVLNQYKSKVVISDTAPVLPETLESYVYDLYSGKSKDDVDNMYEELNELTDRFTEYRLKKQNRLLCTGFLDFDGAKTEQYSVGRLDFRSPYYLFQASDYSSVDVAQLIYDFGPKWFLEVLPDGRVIVPFSTVTQPPLTAWPGYPFYIGGVGSGAAFYESTSDIPGFPVEVSADGRTLTIKPIVVTKEMSSDYLPAGNYYMNALGVPPMSSELEVLATIKTDIVLTKGWSGTASAASVESPKPVSKRAVSLDGTLVTELPKELDIRSTTELKPKPRVDYKLDETPNIVTVDMVRKSVEELSKINFMKYGYIE